MRLVPALLALSLGLGSLTLAAPALAKEHGSFPMTATDFKAKVDARTKKAREHMEKRAANLDATAAKELRAKFDAGVAKVNAEVSKATADGTVTADEAKAVRQVARELRSAHARHEKQ